MKSQSKLAILILFCMLLITIRMVYLQSHVYLFLVWNLFLGVVPYILSKFAVNLYDRGSRVGMTIVILLCILFLPNASYIVTDLFHLRWRQASPIWFDSVMIFTFALTGLALFYKSIDNLEKISGKFMSKPYTFISTTVLIFASAFGMYLGRFLRFNSWDLISDPIYIIKEVAMRIIYPFEHTQAWSMTLIYGLFLLVLYIFMKPSEKVA